ncbi:MAG: hypothetical protein ACKOD2_05160 [Ilumatobacteraceae bacterium]
MTSVNGSGRAARAIRVASGVVFVLCIAGLIVSSIAGNNEGWVLSIGSCGAVAAVILIVTTLVSSSRRMPPFADAEAEAIERRIESLVTAGADESEIRELVRQAVRLGRGL